MINISRNSFDEIYHTLFRYCQDYGTKMCPRGKATREIRPVFFEINNPLLGLYTGKSRKLNYRFFAVECLSYLAGWGNSEAHTFLLTKCNSQFNNFIDKETGFLNNQVSYGPKLVEQLPKIYDILKEDAYSRQACLTILDKNDLSEPNTMPCTLSLSFYMDQLSSKEKPKLSMTVSMRSNDLNWGTPYDVASFCSIQIAMAESLGWELGKYVHYASSLHYYEESMPNIESFACEVFNYPTTSLPYGNSSSSFSYVQGGADIVLNSLHAQVKNGRKFEDWYGPFESNNYWKMWGDLIRLGKIQ